MTLDALLSLPLLSAFLVGLLGGVHCVGMCGGIVGALSLGARPGAGRPRWGLLLDYNLGRIASYTVAGALMGGIGALAAHLVAVQHAQQVLTVIAGLFMLALGLYLAGWWRGLARVEQAGSLIWRRIEPLGRRLIPVRTPLQALLLGLVWGWLPCGLVYSMLIWAISSGGTVQGALLLLAFGLGTLPNLLLMGVFAARLSRWMGRPAVRITAGLLVMAFGLLTIARGWLVAA